MRNKIKINADATTKNIDSRIQADLDRVERALGLLRPGPVATVLLGDAHDSSMGDIHAEIAANFAEVSRVINQDIPFDILR